MQDCFYYALIHILPVNTRTVCSWLNLLTNSPPGNPDAAQKLPGKKVKTKGIWKSAMLFQTP